MTAKEEKDNGREERNACDARMSAKLLIRELSMKNVH
mgnify:CR=1 FL=1